MGFAFTFINLSMSRLCGVAYLLHYSQNVKHHPPLFSVYIHKLPYPWTMYMKHLYRCGITVDRKLCVVHVYLQVI